MCEKLRARMSGGVHEKDRMGRGHRGSFHRSFFLKRSWGPARCGLAALYRRPCGQPLRQTARPDQRLHLFQAGSGVALQAPMATSAIGAGIQAGSARQLEAGGVVYATAGSRRAAVALDATSGELLWVHGERKARAAPPLPRQLSGRGPAYWSDGKATRTSLCDARLPPDLPGCQNRAACRCVPAITARWTPKATETTRRSSPTSPPAKSAGNLRRPRWSAMTVLVGSAFPRRLRAALELPQQQGFGARAMTKTTGAKLWGIPHTIPRKE